MDDEIRNINELLQPWSNADKPVHSESIWSELIGITPAFVHHEFGMTWHRHTEIKDPSSTAIFYISYELPHLRSEGNYERVQILTDGEGYLKVTAQLDFIMCHPSQTRLILDQERVRQEIDTVLDAE